MSHFCNHHILMSRLSFFLYSIFSYAFYRQMRFLAQALFLLSISGSAQAIDLLEAYRLASTYDKTFSAARFTFYATAEKVPQARASLLPTVYANANSNHSQGQYTFENMPTSHRKNDSWSWNLQLTQPLIRAQNWQTFAQAQATLAQAQAQFYAAEQEMMLRVAQAYFEYDIARETLHAADANVAFLQQQFELAQRGLERGTHAITDIHEANSRYALARAQVFSALSEKQNRLADLEKIIGPLPETAAIASMKEHVVIPPPQPNTIEAWSNMAQIHAPIVQAQQAYLTSIKHELVKNKFAHLPTLDLTASYGHQRSSGNEVMPTNYANQTRTAQLGIQLHIPLYAGGATQAKARETQFEFYKARDELENTQLQARVNAQRAFAGVMNGLSQIDALTVSVTSAMSALKGNQVAYRVGTRSNIEVLNATQQLYVAQRDLIKARYETLLHSLKLKATVGQLKQEDFVSINQWFRYQ